MFFWMKIHQNFYKSKKWEFFKPVLVVWLDEIFFLQKFHELKIFSLWNEKEKRENETEKN